MFSVDGKTGPVQTGGKEPGVSKDELLRLIKRSGSDIVKSVVAELSGLIRAQGRSGGGDVAADADMTPETMGRLAGLMATRASVEEANFERLGGTVKTRGDKKNESTVDLLSQL